MSKSTSEKSHLYGSEKTEKAHTSFHETAFMLLITKAHVRVIRQSTVIILYLFSYVVL